jgi:capsular polysaccharide export protein
VTARAALPASDEKLSGGLAILSPGLMRLAGELRELSGLTPGFRLLATGRAAAVAGWGHKPTARRARQAAKRLGLPYLAFEDGFLRSLKPGTAQRPHSMVMDRSGIYYDARQPCDLETLLETASFSDADLDAGREVMALIASHRLSKYNSGAEAALTVAAGDTRPLILVVDQTAGDESIAGGLADASRFAAMAEAARRENPGARIIAKLHPETLAGTKPGHLAEAEKRWGFDLLAQNLSPWVLFDHRPHVYTVSSQFGFEALLAGCRVSCFGMPFYAGWGLTDDRIACARRSALRSREELAAAVYLHYGRYFDAWHRTPVDVFTALDQLAFLRRGYLGNARRIAVLGVARWKRPALRALLDGAGGAPGFYRLALSARKAAAAAGGPVALWGGAAIAGRQALASEGLECLTIEDGFLRSVGLGAAFVQPLSLVFDRRGIYFDPRSQSDIEHDLAHGDISAEECRRAAALRQAIVAARLTKYNVRKPAGPLPEVPPGMKAVLVPGQVADDAAVALGRPASFPPGANVNALLLAAARARHRDAFVIFKPHPDVEHLGRSGALTADEERLADCIARKTPLEALFPIVHHIETYASLAGFEGLLRGIKVSVHGAPFYAGWGLTEDLSALPRRQRHRSLDELVAVALIRYPRYWDPASGLPCPPEVVLARLGDGAQAGLARTMAGLLLGRAVIMARKLRRSMGGDENDAG